MYLVSDKKIIRYIFLVSLIYLIPYTVDFLYIMTSHIYLSDLSYYKIPVNLPNLFICFIYMKGLAWYFLGIYLCLLIHNRKYITRITFSYKRRTLELALIIFFLLQILFAYKFKIGAAGGHSGNKFSALMNLINIEAFFPIYYFLYRDKINIRFYIVIILYITLKVVQGWSGFILNLFFIEAFYRIYKGKIGIKFILIIPIVILFGGLVYQIMYPVKIFMRTGSFETITYIEALIKLITRLSCFSNCCAAYEFSANILRYNEVLNVPHGDILYFFNAITPSSLYDKSFQPLNRLFLLGVLNKGGFANFDCGSTYYYLLFKVSIFDFIIYFGILIINSVVYRFASEVLIPSKICICNSMTFSNVFYHTFLIGSGLNGVPTWIFILFPVFFLYSIGGIKIFIKRRSYENNC